MSVSLFFQDEYGGLAQLGEHLPYKQRVTGSSPVPPTTYFFLLKRLMSFMVKSKQKRKDYSFAVLFFNLQLVLTTAR